MNTIYFYKILNLFHFNKYLINIKNIIKYQVCYLLKVLQVLASGVKLIK